MNRFHGATWLLLVAMAAFLTGCADEASRDEPDAGLKVILRLSQPSVQTSVNDSVEVSGTAFLLTTTGEFVAHTPLRLSTDAQMAHIAFSHGTLHDTTDANGGVDFVYVVYGSEGPGVQRLRASTGAVMAEQELRVDVYDWYVTSLVLTASADTVRIPVYNQYMSVLATVTNAAGEPMQGIRVYYTCDHGWYYPEPEYTDSHGHLELTVYHDGPGDYCFTAAAGWQRDTLCVPVVIFDPESL